MEKLFCDICKKDNGNNRLNKIEGFGLHKPDFKYEICNKCYEEYSEIFSKKQKCYKTVSKRYADFKGYGNWHEIAEDKEDQ